MLRLHGRLAASRLCVSLLLVLLVGASSAVWTGCRAAPVTGRRQLLLLPEDREIEMGETAYAEVVEQESLSTNEHYQAIVQRVGERIAAVAGRPDYDWEFTVLAGPEANAFALPGGKVAFYEGIVPVCQSEAGIAVVMSHEIAHALLRHGGERMSQTAVKQGLGKLVEWGTGDREEKDRKLILGAYGVVSEYGVMLPYSRKHESEADEVGLRLLARAGYDPEEAPRFWERFAATKDGEQPPELISTHPADERRAANLRKLLPEAVEVYANAPERYGTGEVIQLAEGQRPAGGDSKFAPVNYERAEPERTAFER